MRRGRIVRGGQAKIQASRFPHMFLQPFNRTPAVPRLQALAAWFESLIAVGAAAVAAQTVWAGTFEQDVG